jgi:hypothetical protein
MEANMPTAKVQAVIEQVKQLSVQEQQELRAMLESSRPTEPYPSSEDERRRIDELNLRLLAKGLISHIPPPLTAEEGARFRAWKPVPIEGKPLSETIIEERR